MGNNLTDAEESRLLGLSLTNGDLAALYTAPGTDSAAGTEVSGGGYARQSITWGSPFTSGQDTVRENTNSIGFAPLPAGMIGGWAVLTSAGVRRWHGLFYERVGECRSADSAFHLTSTSTNGIIDNAPVFVNDGPPGITQGQVYYAAVISSTVLRFRATPGGEPLTFGSGTQVYRNVTIGRGLDVGAGDGVYLTPGSIRLGMR